jgi:hypothetical protein
MGSDACAQCRLHSCSSCWRLQSCVNLLCSVYLAVQLRAVRSAVLDTAVDWPAFSSDLVWLFRALRSGLLILDSDVCSGLPRHAVCILVMLLLVCFGVDVVYHSVRSTVAVFTPPLYLLMVHHR